MDSCIGVEQDLDKAITKFTNLNEHTDEVLQDIINKVEELRREIAQQPPNTPLTPEQAQVVSELASTIKQNAFQLSTDHRELHATVSRVGKSIDRHFVADYAAVAPKAEMFCSDENRPIMEQAIAQHLYRQGLEDVGDTFVAEAEISGVERTCTFASVQRCATALAEGDPTPALQWAEQHMQELQHSPLPFTLHRMYALKLAREVGVGAAIEYARSTFPRHAARHERALQAAVCARVLPALHDIRSKMSHPHVIAAWAEDELPFEVDLGDEGGGYHSVFACPILRQQASDQNPPMRLLCGHVISRDALNKLATAAKLKCPYCPMEQSPAEARQIFFS